MTSPETLNPDPVEANPASGAVTSPVPAEANLWQATRSPVSLLNPPEYSTATRRHENCKRTRVELASNTVVGRMRSNSPCHRVSGNQTGRGSGKAWRPKCEPVMRVVSNRKKCMTSEENAIDTANHVLRLRLVVVTMEKRTPRRCNERWWWRQQ
ncbi:hypothetical protein BJ322DRAFT_1021192 [Thelephora terrestris]|uniref:Uncharacterized protein n=1 Tax=Thelephora terrestris TaxID=56493 RepID=A0A9P6HD16_9AGAM|nr:hypothetical protein BJ322DRAFT_1021192 [Thelephora terrestris]